MGMATCEGTPGLTKDAMEGIYLTAGPGTPGDPTVGGSCPAETCLLWPATLNSTERLANGDVNKWEIPEVPDNLLSIHKTLHKFLHAIQHI